MSAAYYDLYAEEDTLFVANLNILTPESTTAILKRPDPNPVPMKTLYVPPELKAIGILDGEVTNIIPSFIVKQNNVVSSSGTLISMGISLDSINQDHNVVLSRQMGINPAMLPGLHYIYEFTLQFYVGTTPHILRILQGKFILTKTLKPHS